MQKISLIGFMGSGKSTVGKILASKIGYDFIDTDEEIVKAYKPIADIFDEVGNVGFRNIERKILRQFLPEDRQMVIATGGGIVTLMSNFRLLKEQTFMIHLITDPEIIFERIFNDLSRSERIRAGKSLEFIRIVNEEREFLHSQAHLRVENNTTAEDCANKIAEHLTNIYKNDIIRV